MAIPTPNPSELDTPALDAYSKMVTGVAADLTPRVAALQAFGERRLSRARSAVQDDDVDARSTRLAFV